MKFPIDYKNFKYVSDNTQEISEDTLFLLTTQNKRYFEKLSNKPPFITPKELIEIWNLKDLEVIGVTGTNGKTTTTALIYSLLLDLGFKAGLLGTRGFFANDKKLAPKTHTTPSILEILYYMKKGKEEEEIDYFVMEVSSHAIAQNRIEDLSFALKVHTNITQDHLDFHKSIEEYRRVKSSFFLDESRKLINADDIKNIVFNPKNAYTYGIDSGGDFKIIAYSLQNGISGIVQYKSEQATFYSPMMGTFNLYNILAAIASIKILTNLSLETIASNVENFGGVSGRMEVVSTKPLIIVDFAHTPDGIYRVLDSMKDKDLVVVFGAGGDRDKSKRALMGRAAGLFAKRIYLTSDNPRSEDPLEIIKDIKEGLKGKEGVYEIVDRFEAIKKAILELEDNEVLLVLGKGDEEFLEIGEEKIPFDDRKVIKNILNSQKDTPKL